MFKIFYFLYIFFVVHSYSVLVIVEYFIFRIILLVCN